MQEFIMIDCDCPRESVTVPPGISRHKERSDDRVAAVNDSARITQPEIPERKVSTREFTRPDIDLSLEQILKADSRLAVAMFDTRLRVQRAAAVGLDNEATWEIIHKNEDLQRIKMELKSN